MQWSARRVLSGIALAMIAIQFVPVPLSNPPVESGVAASAPVLAILRRACYDCHSRETAWPWYSRVAPASWLVAYDVWEGRSELDFSAWNRIRPDEQAKKVRKIWKEVSEGEMPPWYYLLAHREARLSAGDRAMLREWTAGASPRSGATALGGR